MKTSGIIALASMVATLVAPSASFAAMSPDTSHLPYRRPSGSCTPVDLRGPTLGANYQQADRNWCFAFSAADLISHKAKKRVAPADIAMGADGAWSWEFQSALGLSESERGSPLKLILERATERRLCLEKDMPLDRTRAGANASTWEKIEGLKRSIDDFSASPSQNRQELEVVCDRLSAASGALPMIDLRVLMEIVEESSERDLLMEVTRELGRHCEHKRVELNLNVKVRKDRAAGPATGSRLFSTIDKQLDGGSIVAIQYWQEFLKSEHPHSVEAQGSVGDHASVVVGRRTNPLSGRCEYLVRNSWGASCEPYSKKIECDEGNLWIAEDLLNLHLRQTVHLEEAKGIGW